MGREWGRSRRGRCVWRGPLAFFPLPGLVAAGGCGRAGATRSRAGAGLFRGNGAEMGCILIKQKIRPPAPHVKTSKLRRGREWRPRPCSPVSGAPGFSESVKNRGLQERLLAAPGGVCVLNPVPGCVWEEGEGKPPPTPSRGAGPG